MNVAAERAREACDSCRKSHKKCTYDDNSTRCLRCEKRNTTCSLFLSAEHTVVPQQAPPTLMPVGPPDSWPTLGTPHGSSASSTLSYQFPLPGDYQGDYQWPTAGFAGNMQGEYSAASQPIFQGSANHHDIEQPRMNPDGLYTHSNVFGAPDGT